MSEKVFKLPDLGEGTVEAEIVAWHVEPGDEITEGQHVVDVMTDKASVEVPAPFGGRVLRTSGSPGDRIAVGAELMAIEVSAASPRVEQTAKPGVTPSLPPEPVPERSAPESSALEDSVSVPASNRVVEQPAAAAESPAAPRARPITSPSIRRKARQEGIDLVAVPGTGPRGRILMRDLEAYRKDRGGDADTVRPAAVDDAAAFEAIKVIGVRRIIAERMSQSKREIPHFAYVEEIDVEALDDLRRHLNSKYETALSVLPFVAVALIRALEQYPQCNAHFDAEAGVIRRFRRVHLGIATQTPEGLKVPVVREADRLSLWRLAAEIGRLAEAARTNRAARADLSGSTITITSLGRIGGIASTPVINHPEVAIIGINRIVERAVVRNGQLCARKMMNLSSSFDHRFVDGFEAASLVQDMKERLEHPSALFIDDP